MKKIIIFCVLATMGIFMMTQSCGLKSNETGITVVIGSDS